jgi:monofunctional biosynthetic peptidoglycan transglycosylase
MAFESQPVDSGKSVFGETVPPAPDAAPAPKHAKRRWLRLVICFAAVLAIGYQSWIFAQIWWWREHNPASTAFMRQGLERIRAKSAKRELHQQWAAYEHISEHLKRAVLTVEDEAFVSHRGFDWKAIRGAYDRNQQEKRSIHGGSSITQQLAKNLFLSPQRSYARKAEEAVITVMLEQLLSKRRILEIYLNVIEWGDGIYGAEAAAQHYFSVSAADLDEEQAARLAAVIPAPRRYNPLRESQFIQGRIAVILALKQNVLLP